MLNVENVSDYDKISFKWLGSFWDGYSYSDKVFRFSLYYQIVYFIFVHINKHLMTGPKKNSEFCFIRPSKFPEAQTERSIDVKGKQNSLFLAGPVINCFVIPPNSKIEKKKETTKKSFT